MEKDITEMVKYNLDLIENTRLLARHNCSLTTQLFES